MTNKISEGRHDNGSEPKPQTNESKNQTPAIWLTPTGSSLLILMLSVLAYFIGVVRLDIYFGLYGTDWKLFPLDKPDYIYVGTVTVMHSILLSLDAIGKKWAAVGATMLFGLITALVIVIFERLKERGARTTNGRKRKLTQWHRDLMFTVITTLGMPPLFFFPVLLLGIPLVLPEIIGEAIARRDFAQDAALIAKGCKPQKQPQCFELVESGKVLVSGILLYATKDRALIHDGKGAAVWPLEKRELVPYRPTEQAEVGAQGTPATAVKPHSP